MKHGVGGDKIIGHAIGDTVAHHSRIIDVATDQRIAEADNFSPDPRAAVVQRDGGAQAFQPPGIRNAIVIGKGDPFSLGLLNACIACRRGAFVRLNKVPEIHRAPARKRLQQGRRRVR